MSETKQPKVIQATPEFIAKLTLREHQKIKAEKLLEQKAKVPFLDIFVTEAVAPVVEEKSEILAEQVTINFPENLISEKFVNRKVKL